MQTHNFSLFESIKRRILRIEISQVFIAICVVLLAIWCGYNIREIFMKYNQDETIISLENSPPGITEFPGITICAPSIFKPQKLAGMIEMYLLSLFLQCFCRNVSKNFWCEF